MKTYIYYCYNCSDEHETIRSSPPLECEVCGSEEINIQFQCNAYD